MRIQTPILSSVFLLHFTLSTLKHMQAGQGLAIEASFHIPESEKPSRVFLQNREHWNCNPITGPTYVFPDAPCSRIPYPYVSIQMLSSYLPENMMITMTESYRA